MPRGGMSGSSGGGGGGHRSSGSHSRGGGGGHRSSSSSSFSGSGSGIRSNNSFGSNSSRPRPTPPLPPPSRPIPPLPRPSYSYERERDRQLERERLQDRREERQFQRDMASGNYAGNRSTGTIQQRYSESSFSSSGGLTSTPSSSAGVTSQYAEEYNETSRKLSSINTICSYGIIGFIVGILFFLISIVMLVTAQAPASKIAAVGKPQIENETSNFFDKNGELEKAQKGLEYFQDKTGINVYLWITDFVNGKSGDDLSDDELTQAVQDKYDAVFPENKSGLVVLFHEYDNDKFLDWTWYGINTATIYDSDEDEVLFQNFEDNYYSDKSDGEFVAETFKMTANTMMADHRTFPKTVRTIALFVILGSGVVVVIFTKKQKDLKDKLEDIRNSSAYDKQYGANQTAEAKAKQSEEETLMSKYL